MIITILSPGSSFEVAQLRKIAYKIAEETGMNYRWVMKYLPDRFKDDAQSERASSAARRAVEENPEFEERPKGTVTMQVYTSTNFVNVMLGKKFYEQLEEMAKKLEATPDKLIYNAMLLILKIEGMCTES